MHVNSSKYYIKAKSSCGDILNRPDLCPILAPSPPALGALKRFREVTSENLEIIDYGFGIEDPFHNPKDLPKKLGKITSKKELAKIGFPPISLFLIRAQTYN